MTNLKREHEVGMESSMKICTHYVAPVKKANSMLGVVRKNISTMWPHLEYFAQFWLLKAMKDILEKVQKRQTKIIRAMDCVPMRKECQFCNIFA